MVNINGTRLRWGQFKKQFLEDAGKKNWQSKELVLNQGDPLKEKGLYWSRKEGFSSDHSDDQHLHFKRFLKFMPKP